MILESIKGTNAQPRLSGLDVNLLLLDIIRQTCMLCSTMCRLADFLLSVIAKGADSCTFDPSIHKIVFHREPPYQV